MSTNEIHEAAIAHGRAAEFMDAQWQRVAPCHWKAVHQVGVNVAPYVLRVRLGEGAYEWDIHQNDELLASGEARTPMQGRSLARRAAQDLTATMPPAPLRKKSERTLEDEGEASATTRHAIDQQIIPYLGLSLLAANVAFAYYGTVVGTGVMLDLVTALCLLMGGVVLHLVWQNLE
ncbi:MAG: hypothetical protein ACI8PZ_006343 [Myxococcota bacterium]|jgi:hypothetical protein